MMKVEFSKSAIKLLKKLDDAQQKRIRSKIIRFRDSLDRQQAVPFDEPDIKKLKGNWQGFSEFDQVSAALSSRSTWMTE